MRQEAGTALPMLLALVAAVLIVVALATDVVLYGATYREAAAAADAGAEAGAAVVAVDAAYGGTVSVAIEAARRTAVETATARPRPTRSAAATVTAGRVCVRVTERYRPRFLGGLGIGEAPIVVTACAVPRRG